jgi:hypothetical protein
MLAGPVGGGTPRAPAGPAAAATHAAAAKAAAPYLTR